MPAEQEFLREAFVGACRYFTTVLGPGSDAFHYDHLHIDLARHDPRGERRICKPILKFSPRIDPEQQPRGPSERGRRRPIWRPSTWSRTWRRETPISRPLRRHRRRRPSPPRLRPPRAIPRRGGYAADLPASHADPRGVSPSSPYPQAPLPPVGRPVEQTYAPPRPERSAGQPMMLNRHAIY